MAEPQSVLIIGAGHAGGSAAAFLRQFGFAGAITLIGEEPVPPYQRPPLSKGWLKGDMSDDGVLLRPREFYAEHGISLLLGCRAVHIDRAARTVRLDDGRMLGYERLILATGRRARRLAIPGIGFDGVLELRTLADAQRLKSALAGSGRRLAVIGGGYVGLEAAATARALGADVVVIEKEPRVMARVASGVLSGFYQAAHRAHGVRFELGMGVDAISGAAGRVSGVQLGDGRRIDADAVLVGIGAVANDELASAAGLECANGVVVDLAARTADSCIYAVGDCSRRPLPHYGLVGHLESVQNALEQARHAAADIVGRPLQPSEVPWFWSDQYDLKLQIAGLAHGADHIVVRGEPLPGAARPRLAIFHLAADHRLRAVEAVNATQEFLAGKQFIGTRQPLDEPKLADAAVPMKDVAAVTGG
jgi:3-phenylpropionate/trans-cinnamate dioxygenase ferredoxin reductase component